MKKVRNILIIISIFIIVAGMIGSKKSDQQPIQKEKSGLAPQIVQLIQKAHTLTVSKVRPIWGGEKKFQMISKKYQLGEDKLKELIEILQDSDSYFFDRMKTCLFVPELVIQMGDDLQILINQSGKQLEFNYLGENQRVECDPSYLKIMKIFENVEWEDLDEAD